MMTSIVSLAWKSVKPHVPLIKFRKGGHSAKGHSAGPATATASSKKAPNVTASAQQRPIIEDWQLPPRYRRQLLDDKEIDAINSGGAY